MAMVTMTKEAAVQFLLERFPGVRRRLEEAEDAQIAPPYFVYGLLASDMIENAADAKFLDASVQFIDDLAESEDPLLEEVLVLSILERLAESPDLVGTLKERLGEKARGFLLRVEQDLYGRERK
jgi:hypothetical protein